MVKVPKFWGTQNVLEEGPCVLEKSFQPLELANIKGK
jgi:hypothetical protein